MILFCFGTRPEWLKILPIIKLLNREEYKLLFTGQHTDLLTNIDVDYQIKINNSNDRLNSVIADCITQFPYGNFDKIIVQGDTASAFGCAIAAYNRGIDVYYVESGLRTYDLNNPYPEEAYRQMISRISKVNFCPTNLSFKNLMNENISGICHVVGNTSLDNLRKYKDNCIYDDYIVITMHRRENHNIVYDWFNEFNSLAEKNTDYKFIFPIHPNPNIQKYKYLLRNVQVINPLNHEDFLNLLINCKLIITDSGGIQEEASFLNKKTIVCRKTTERPEGILSGHIHMCSTPNELHAVFDKLILNYHINIDCPYGDGYASEKIIKYIK
jgi:UDP-N-acetylglucosamine 2-epimerase (non-hydrolysing)